ncbi:MAG: hypothetical protein MI864_25050 [Pseudomonadales bacterium]|nr:hypothetical protein [Pseudomonadales bacterium]
MLKSIIDIGGHMIRARVLDAIGDQEGADEERFNAGLIAQIDGYHHAYKSDKTDELRYLVYYPELRSAWEIGYGTGVWSWEFDRCSDCQNPDVEMCSVHDINHS